MGSAAAFREEFAEDVVKDGRPRLLPCLSERRGAPAQDRQSDRLGVPVQQIAR
jgi:hypothetical protein